MNAAPATAKAPVVAPAGNIHLTSEPVGVRVFISGMTQQDWVTPFTVNGLDPGTYEVKFSKSGYVARSTDVEVKDGKTANFHAELTEAGGKITVTSAPSGASIFLNGQPTNKTTPTTIAVESGTYQIEVRKAGFVEESAKTNLKDGEAYTFAPKLEPSPDAGQPRKSGFFGKVFGKERIPDGKGLLILKSRPLGATIFLNGKASAQPTPLKEALDPGRYRVMLRMQKHKVAFRELTVEKGMITEITIDLEPTK